MTIEDSEHVERFDDLDVEIEKLLKETKPKRKVLRSFITRAIDGNTISLSLELQESGKKPTFLNIPIEVPDAEELRSQLSLSISKAYGIRAST